MDYKKNREGSEKDPEKTKEVETTNIPVIEESVTISKEKIATGKVTVRKIVREEQVTVDVPLIQSNIEVERVAINKYVNSPPEIRHEGETTVFPILKEIVEKRLILVEEVRVTQKTIQTTSQEEVTLRKEEVKVERERLNTGNTGNI